MLGEGLAWHFYMHFPAGPLSIYCPQSHSLLWEALPAPQCPEACSTFSAAINSTAVKTARVLPKKQQLTTCTPGIACVAAPE